MMLWAIAAGWYLQRFKPARNSWGRWIALAIIDFEALNFRVAISALNLGLCSRNPSTSKEG